MANQSKQLKNHNKQIPCYLHWTKVLAAIDVLAKPKKFWARAFWNINVFLLCCVSTAAIVTGSLEQN